MPIKISRSAATTVTFSTPQEIIINHADDSIRLGDGTNLLSSTTVGAKVGLDVSVVRDPTTVAFTKPYDAITAAFPSATQEVYSSRVGGISGTVQEVITVNYVDATKEDITDISRV
jgi:hypothetical protein